MLGCGFASARAPISLSGIQAVLTLNNPELLQSKAYVDGAWIGADGGEAFAVTDLGADEARRAIEAATKSGVPCAPRPGGSVRRRYGAEGRHGRDQ